MNASTGQVTLVQPFRYLQVLNETWWLELTVFDYFDGPFPVLNTTWNLTVFPKSSPTVFPLPAQTQTRVPFHPGPR